jgi:hypothetical protein
LLTFKACCGDADQKSVDRSARTRALKLAIFTAAMIAAVLGSLPLLALVGAASALLTAHTRVKRRAAKAGLWAAAGSLVWVALVGGLHAGRGWALVGTVLAGAIAIVLNRPTRRRRRDPWPLGPPGQDAGLEPAPSARRRSSSGS